MANQHIHVYLGDTKDTMRQAIGLGIEALANHEKVIMIQFLNKEGTGLYETIKKLEPQFKLFYFENTTLMFAKKVMDTEECDVVILTNVFEAINSKLITIDALIDIIDNKPHNICLILTGDVLPQEIESKVDNIIYIERL